jgi:hypothetical protein
MPRTSNGAPGPMTRLCRVTEPWAYKEALPSHRADGQAARSAFGKAHWIIGQCLSWPQQPYTTRRSPGRSRFGGNGVTRDANGFSIISHFSSLTSANIRTFSGGYSFGRPSLHLIRQRDHRARPHRPILPLIEEERVWVTAMAGATGIEPVTPTMST